MFKAWRLLSPASCACQLLLSFLDLWGCHLNYNSAVEAPPIPLCIDTGTKMFLKDGSVEVRNAQIVGKTSAIWKHHVTSHWNSSLSFHLWQLPAQENSFPLLLSVIIQIAGFSPPIFARGISSSPRVPAFSLYFGWLIGLGFCLTWAFVHVAPFSQMWHFFHIVVFHSAALSSSPIHCSVWLQLSLIIHSVCPVSITITLTFTVIS